MQEPLPSPLTPGNLYALDIETFTGVFADGRQANGLDPNNSRVMSVAVWSASERVYLEAEDEVVVLDLLAAWIEAHPAAVIVTWNGAGFDFPFLAARAEQTGSRLASLLQLTVSHDRVPPYGPLPGFSGGCLVRAGACDHVDVMFAYRGLAESAGIRNSLKPVSRLFGIEVLEVDREAMHDLDPMELVAYNFSDVRATYLLALAALERLPGRLDSAAG